MHTQAHKALLVAPLPPSPTLPCIPGCSHCSDTPDSLCLRASVHGIPCAYNAVPLSLSMPNFCQSFSLNTTPELSSTSTLPKVSGAAVGLHLRTLFS